MSSTAAVRGLFRTPRAGSGFRGIESSKDAPRQWVWQARADNARDILYRSGHTIARLSAATRDRFGISSSYFIPPTFLYKLRIGITPQVCQIAALSQSTGYRFVDWLRLFGFDPHQIPRLQMRLHTEHTVLVTPVESGRDFFLPQVYPGHETFLGSNSSQSGRSRYQFAKIGSRDAEIYPKLSPGNIVRIDRLYGGRFFGDHVNGEGCSIDHSAGADHLWLVELPDGLTCCQLRWIDHQQIVLLPNRAPWGCWPLRLPTEARVLGLVDTNGEAPYSGVQCRDARIKTLSELLRISRGRTGLTFRSAHGLTRTIARIMGNPDYQIALGMLSDYEVMGKLPRHAAKILSLCIVYCMDIWELLKAAGVYIDESAKLPLPAPSRLQLSSPYVDDSMQRSRAVS
jgi:hypothetical protein